MIFSNVDKLLCKKIENCQVVNELNNKKCVFDVEPKRFRWNFDLENNLWKVMEMHFNWMPREIALTFIYMYPNLNITPAQVK
jgi:hypothetical protein